MDESESHDRDLLLAFLNERDVSCPLCAYNLRNCTAGSCPECGKVIELAVKARDVSHQSWAILVASLSLTAGVGLIFLYMVIRQGLPPPSDVQPALIFTFVGTIPLAIEALACRRRFLRLIRQTQFYIASAAVALVVLLFFLILSTMP